MMMAIRGKAEALVATTMMRYMSCKGRVSPRTLHEGWATHVDDRSRQDHSTQEIDEDEEPHREAAEPKELGQEDQLAKIMNS
jgi:hypothetical protein